MLWILCKSGMVYIYFWGFLINYARHIVVESETKQFIAKYLTAC